MSILRRRHGHNPRKKGTTQRKRCKNDSPRSHHSGNFGSLHLQAVCGVIRWGTRPFPLFPGVVFLDSSSLD